MMPSSTETARRSTADVYQHHGEALLSRDLDALMSDYAPDALVVGPEGVLHGHDEIRAMFARFLGETMPPGSRFDVEAPIIDGEVAYITWEAESDTVSIPFASDTFVVREGLIVIQTIAALIIPRDD